MLVVDTSVLVAHLCGDKKATAFLAKEQSGGLIVPALAAWELWRGATNAARTQAVEALLESVDLDAFQPAMARLAGELQVQHRERGIERPAFDLLIASHALFHAVPLATMDRDYDSVRGLRVVRV